MSVTTQFLKLTELFCIIEGSVYVNCDKIIMISNLYTSSTERKKIRPTATHSEVWFSIWRRPPEDITRAPRELFINRQRSRKPEYGYDYRWSALLLLRLGLRYSVYVAMWRACFVNVISFVLARAYSVTWRVLMDYNVSYITPAILKQ